MQKCRINMIKQSFLEGNSRESESFIADLIETGGKLNFRYEEKDQNANVQVMAQPDHVEIIRHGEVISRIRLRQGMTQDISIDSPFGQLKMESNTIDIKKSNNLLVVEYQLLQEKQIVGHFKITWQIMKEDMS